MTQHSYLNQFSLFCRSLLFNIYFFSVSACVAIFGCFLLFGSRKTAFIVSHVWEKLVRWGSKYIIGLDYQVEGLENLPAKGPYIIASKHQSAWETCSFCGIFPGTIFISKITLSYIPFMGFHFAKQKVILVDRRLGHKARENMLQQAKERAAQGDRIVIFPEGERTFIDQPSKYKSGVYYMHEELQVPVVPVALNSGVFWPRNSFIKRPGIITVSILPPIQPGLQRDVFMDQLQEVIEKRSKELCHLS